MNAPSSNTETKKHFALFNLLLRLSSLNREHHDSAELQAVLNECADNESPRNIIRHLSQQLNLTKPHYLETPDAAQLPLLISTAEGRWGILQSKNSDNKWVTLWFNEENRKVEETLYDAFSQDDVFIRFKLASRFQASKSPTLRLVAEELLAHKGILGEIAAGSLVVTGLALATSFFSMHVYNRVVPTNAMSTLAVLTIGVLMSTLFELMSKWIRGKQLHELTDGVDQRLARNVFSRFLNIRLDQLPNSVGTTSARIRGYESVRSFLMGLTTHVIVDAPLGLLTLVIIAFIGGSLALVPLVFLVLGVITGLFFRKRTEYWAAQGTPAKHFKMGLLVESIEGAETIKAGNAGWRMLSRWLDISNEARYYDRLTGQLSEHSQYLIAALQQVAYVAIVAIGAMQIGQGSLTVGSLIACSILSGRVLQPIAMIPNLLVQWATTKMSIQDLDRLWSLQQDHPDASEVLMPNRITGNYQLENVAFSHAGQLAIQVPELSIRAGERIGIVGNIGGGKTTLLRLLAGLYKPQVGRISLDGMALDLIAKSKLVEQVSYMSQEGRLFAGTLRENLVMGMTDPGDDVLTELAHKTGLYANVIANHPKGLARDIFEGGNGLSGGQRQLVHLTRALLARTNIMLLDEPSASMDQTLERQVIHMIGQHFAEAPEKTLILVTHKPQMLVLVDRLIVISQNKILLDGPKEAVFQRLSDMNQQAQQQSQPQAAAH